ncbi:MULTISPECIES: hypothetical protein [Acidovorax]|jgi:hypothetical protein|uniref:Uncharacterized protein n=1 Tax=Acidovorax facilis TaxID=12917 RepID=A0ABV8DJC5_9BURK|nr:MULTISPECIES: hypothetical protein [Acidovorax]KQB60384.1 hypothetical protein AE621_05415 [Acidovorax sp. SD340]MBO1010593.1 hypothetical protein [Acidovorax sp. SD340]MCO4244098.1 hypothetical protein [Acidovorax facilis]
MFATPFTAPLHETLASHVFGRFMSQRAQPSVPEVVMAPVHAALVVEDDAIPDLAQRVREVGEW